MGAAAPHAEPEPGSHPAARIDRMPSVRQWQVAGPERTKHEPPRGGAAGCCEALMKGHTATRVFTHKVARAPEMSGIDQCSQQTADRWARGAEGSRRWGAAAMGTGRGGAPFLVMKCSGIGGRDGCTTLCAELCSIKPFFKKNLKPLKKTMPLPPAASQLCVPGEVPCAS